MAQPLGHRLALCRHPRFARHKRRACTRIDAGLGRALAQTVKRVAPFSLRRRIRQHRTGGVCPLSLGLGYGMLKTPHCGVALGLDLLARRVLGKGSARSDAEPKQKRATRRPP
ncbi:hypothetical protein [Sphingomonas koreensis]